jgi:hypothetical protein
MGMRVLAVVAPDDKVELCCEFIISIFLFPGCCAII